MNRAIARPTGSSFIRMKPVKSPHRILDDAINRTSAPDATFEKIGSTSHQALLLKL